MTAYDRQVWKALDAHQAGQTGEAFAILADVITRAQRAALDAALTAIRDDLAHAHTEAKRTTHFTDRDYWNSYAQGITDTAATVDHVQINVTT